MRIGVMDSGIGGLTVLKELLKQHPNQEYIYVGDTLHLPYGEKSVEELEEYTTGIFRFFLEQNVDLIVLACGTLSAKLKTKLTEMYTIPIYDVLTPTLTYLKTLSYQTIGVMATSNTIESHIFKNHLSKKNVLEVACPKLVPYIEQRLPTEDVLQEYLQVVQESEILVLGCTHYPKIEKEIKQYFSKPILTMEKILSTSIELPQETTQKVTLYFTKIEDHLQENIKDIIKAPYQCFPLSIK